MAFMGIASERVLNCQYDSLWRGRSRPISRCDGVKECAADGRCWRRPLVASKNSVPLSSSGLSHSNSDGTVDSLRGERQSSR